MMEISKKDMAEMQILLLQCDDFFQEYEKDFDELEKELKNFERECTFEY